MRNWIKSKLNKLLLLVRKKKKIFFVITLLLILLISAIIKVEYYHKDFLIKQLLINQYFNNIISSEFNQVYSILCEAWEEKDYESFFEALWGNWELIISSSAIVCLHSVFSPFFVFGGIEYYGMVFEKQNVPLLKKHQVYIVGRPYIQWEGIHTLAINTYNLKRYWLGSSKAYLPVQKAIKNFNEIIITEKVNINSYEECVKLIKTLVKLIDGCGFYYKYLILKEEDEFSKDVPCLESTGKVYKKYRAKSLFIFEPVDEDFYYVELHIGNPGAPGRSPTLFKKCTFKVKKNGVVYDFNEIEFVYVTFLNGVPVWNTRIF